jgi:hypothetical protein
MTVKRTLSTRPRALVFVSRSVGGVIGLAGGLYVVFRLQAATGARWESVAVAILMIFTVGVLIVMDQRLRRSLRRVAVDERFLYVSDPSDTAEVTIPLDQIVRVTQRRGKQLRPVSVYLRSSSVAGSPVRFQPAPEWGWAGRKIP